MAIVVCTLLCILVVPAYAAPFTTPEITFNNIQVIQGATAKIGFEIWPDDYKYTRYFLTLYGPDGKSVGTAEDQVYNTGVLVKDIVVNCDTTGFAIGTYTAEVELEYYTLGAWRETPSGGETVKFKVVAQDSNLNDIAIAPDGNYNYYKNGVIDTSFTGLAGPYDYLYVINGTVDFDYAGVGVSGGEIIYVKDGKPSAYSGIGEAEDGTLYYFSRGKLDTEFTGKKTYNGKNYLVENGIAREVCTGTGGEHIWDNGTVSTPAGCDTEGRLKISCTECSVYKLENISPTGHAWDDGKVSEAAGCTKDGTLTITCGNCGETRSEVIEKTGHKWDSGTVTTEPACETEGEKTVACYNCSETKVESIAATGHSWGEETIISEATCTEDGVKKHSCTECGVAETTPIKATGHDFDGLVCKSCGFVMVSFNDVAETDFYYEPVMWAVGKGVTTGLAEKTFGPGNGCTRAQVVTFLWRAAGEPAPTSSNNPFKDIKEGTYYYDAVLWAVENGVTSGLSADTFGPDANCNRGQIVTFLWRAKGEPAPASNANPFRDVAEGQYYYDAVLWAVEKGITTGLSADSFGPNSTCTRGQIVTFLYRAYK